MNVQIMKSGGIVLVTKNLCDAQFKCIECYKAFISFNHLAKHTLKRHGTPISDLTNEVISTGQKLSKATSCLENAISLLESKTNHFYLEKTQENDSNDVMLLHCTSSSNQFPENATNSRKSVGLFTLPNNQAEPKARNSMQTNTWQRDIVKPEQGLDMVSRLAADDGIVLDISKCKECQIDRGCQEEQPCEQSVSLLLKINDKLDGILHGSKMVTSTFSQTTAESQCQVLMSERGTLCFADGPEYLNCDQREPEVLSKKYESATQIENVDNQCHTIESNLLGDQAHSEIEVSQCSSSCGDNKSNDDDNDCIAADANNEDYSNNDGIHLKTSRSSPGEVYKKTPTQQSIVDTHSKSLADFENTKLKILEVVEKCVNEIKSKRKNFKPVKMLEGTEGSNEAVQALLQGMLHSDDSRGCPFVEGCTGKTNQLGQTEICQRLYSTSKGILPPMAVICQDPAEDLDEVSNNSYKQFMKRFWSPNTVQTTGNPRNMSPSDSEGESVGNDMAPYNHSEVLTDAVVRGIKEHTVDALSEDPKQVRHLMDTLVKDLDRWKTVRQSKISASIRVQLEARLASNLKLLGVDEQTQSLSDNAAAMASSELENRMKAIAKDVAPTYFESLKAAYQKEVDRIAKSRAAFQFADRSPD